MASNFATSDRWFSPVMTRTQSNRMYMIAATSQGYVYPIGSNAQDQQLLTAPTIFQSLENAGISWKIYVRPDPNPIDNCPANSVDPSCLLIQSYVKNFQWGQTIPTTYPQNMVSDAQFFLDLQNGTLPSVAQIEPPSSSALDEHPSDEDDQFYSLQDGANYVSTLVNEIGRAHV